jgi:hypothetical protein
MGIEGFRQHFRDFYWCELAGAMLQTVRSGGHPSGFGCHLQGPPGLGSPRTARRRVMRRARLRWLEANLTEEAAAPVAIACNAAIGACEKEVQWQAWKQALGLLALRLEVSWATEPSGTPPDFVTDYVTDVVTCKAAFGACEMAAWPDVEAAASAGAVVPDVIYYDAASSVHVKSDEGVTDVFTCSSAFGACEKGAEAVTDVITYDASRSSSSQPVARQPHGSLPRLAFSQQTPAHIFPGLRGSTICPPPVAADVISSDEDDYYEEGENEEDTDDDEVFASADNPLDVVYESAVRLGADSHWVPLHALFAECHDMSDEDFGGAVACWCELGILEKRSSCIKFVVECFTSK